MNQPDPPARYGKSLSDSGFSATLLNLAPFVLTLATIVTVILFVAPENGTGEGARPFWFDDWPHELAPILGLTIAVALGIGIAYFRGGQAAPDRLQPRVYGELCERWSVLDARVETLCPPDGPPLLDDQPDLVLGRRMACTEARVHRDFVATELGLISGGSEHGPRTTGTRWVLGTGYIDAWTRIHAAEAALFLVAPVDLVIGAALYDEMRLKDSRIENSDDQLHKLRWAVNVLGGARFLTPAPPAATLDDADKTPFAIAQARVALRGVRYAIEEYRDARRNGLVRSRNHLTWTGMLTGLLAYGLLGLAVVVDAPASAVVAAVVFFLVGAVVGLFDQLRVSAASGGETEDDYGLARARLVYSPILSGLAGVGGVVVTTMLYSSLNGPILTAPAAPVPVTPTPVVAMTAASPTADGSPIAVVAPIATATPGPTASPTPTPTPTPAPTATPTPILTPDQSTPPLEIPTMNAIFDLHEDRFGLILAAVFGLAPGLLIDRLQGQANKYKADLQSTKAD